MHQTIRRGAVEKAVKWLMKNNDLYISVAFNNDWHKTDGTKNLGCISEDFESNSVKKMKAIW